MFRGRRGGGAEGLRVVPWCRFEAESHCSGLLDVWNTHRIGDWRWCSAECTSLLLSVRVDDFVFCLDGDRVGQ